MTIELKIDNPELEALILELLQDLKSVRKSSSVQTLPPATKERAEAPKILGKLPTLSVDKVPDDWGRVTPSKTRKPARSVSQPREKVELCPEGFPAHWKSTALSKISARQAFTLSSLFPNERKAAIYSFKFRNWLLENRKVVAERLAHKLGNPYLYIPTWEEHGITQTAANAYEFR